MVEIEIVITQDGLMTTEIKNARPENPACNIFQKLLDADKAAGMVVTDIKMKERHHGH